ncbi:MAG: hypothetical protein ACTSRZ_20625 [Promethearchaeota archaeon]
MNLSVLIDYTAKVGGFTGLALTIKEIVHYLKRPKLKIKKLDPNIDLRKVQYEEEKDIRKFICLHIENNKKELARCSTAKMEVLSSSENFRTLERLYYLHWADSPIGKKTTISEPVDIYKGERRLDVAFTCKNQKFPGCWIAVPISLKYQDQNQAYLPPGEYEVEIEVNCTNGRGEKKRYKIISPEKWDDLDIVEIQRKCIKRLISDFIN